MNKNIMNNNLIILISFQNANKQKNYILPILETINTKKSKK